MTSEHPFDASGGCFLLGYVEFYRSEVAHMVK